MKYQAKSIIFSDLDGTLLKSDHQFSEKTIKFVQNLYEQGIYFCPITARSTEDAVRQAKILGIDKKLGIVSGNNGGQIFDFKNNSWILDARIEKDVLKQIFDKTYMKIGMYKCHFFADDETYVYGPGENSRYWSDIMQLKYTVIKDFESIIKPISHMTIVLDDNVADNGFNIFMKEFNHLNEKLDFIQYTKRVYEVCPKGVNKGNAAKKIMEYLDINSNEVTSYAFGDSHNDIELLDSVKCGVAMKNSIVKLLESADDITEFDNNNDGVINYIEQKILKKGN